MLCCAAVQAPRKFTSGVPGKMGYEDFVWFILSEEDKTTDTAMEYWFRCVAGHVGGCATRCPFSGLFVWLQQMLQESQVGA